MLNKVVKILKSEQDRSVNFIMPTGQECRYVRRTDETIIVYLSSHNGCNQACRMCHLTQTKQTSFTQTTPWEFVEQAQKVLTHYRHQVLDGKEPPARKIHFNWMARGEPLLNSQLIEKWAYIRQNLLGLAALANIQQISFKISTILPKIDEATWFRSEHLPEIYYSLYGVNPDFRKRWFPNAMPLEEAAQKLRYHIARGGRLVLHMAFIKGENDSEEDVSKLIEFILENKLNHAKLNIVRYNPYSPQQGEETDEETLQNHFRWISSFMNQPGSRIVPRVGVDVYGSCGMFFDEH